MWMRQMTLGQIDLEGNGFHKALNAFIILQTKKPEEAQKHGICNSMLHNTLDYTSIKEILLNLNTVR